MEEKQYILIAEDDYLSYAILKHIAGKCGYEALWAKNGIEALKNCKKYNIGLVFMDIDMPLLNGVEATKQIREHDTGLPVIAVTACETYRTRSLNAGCNEFLTKPIRKPAIVEVIRKYLSPVL